MRDQASLKFVELFLGRSDTARIAEPGHIAELAWWPLDQIGEEVRERPGAFTPTFRALFAMYRSIRGTDGG